MVSGPGPCPGGSGGVAARTARGTTSRTTLAGTTSRTTLAGTTSRSALAGLGRRPVTGSRRGGGVPGRVIPPAIAGTAPAAARRRLVAVAPGILVTTTAPARVACAVIPAARLLAGPVLGPGTAVITGFRRGAIRPADVSAAHASSLLAERMAAAGVPPSYTVPREISRRWHVRSIAPLRRNVPSGALLLACPSSAAASRTRLTSAKNVRRCKVVPATTLADFDHVHPEFAVFGGHLVQLRPALHASLVLPKLIAIHIGNVRKLGFPADRAADFGRLAVKLGGSQQVGMSVAYIGDRSAPGLDRCERSPAGQPVVDNGTPCPHDGQGTSELAAGRARRQAELARRAKCPVRASFTVSPAVSLA